MENFFGSVQVCTMKLQLPAICLHLTFIWISILSATNSANILILFPFYSRSHLAFHMGMARSLRSAGHEVTVVHAFPRDIENENFTGIDVSRPNAPSESNHFPIREALRISDGLDVLSLVVSESEIDCHNTLQNKHIQEILKSREKLFDIMIVDVVQVSFECFLPMAEILNVPVIATCGARSWRSIDRLMGNPHNVATVPIGILSLLRQMNFVQRMRNAWACIYEEYCDYVYVRPSLENLNQKYFSNLPHWQKPKPLLTFVNSHQVFVPRPVVPNVVYIGGIHIQPQKPLPRVRTLEIIRYPNFNPFTPIRYQYSVPAENHKLIADELIVSERMHVGTGISNVLQTE